MKTGLVAADDMSPLKFTVKRTEHDLGIHPVGVHDMGVHDWYEDEQRGRTQHGYAQNACTVWVHWHGRAWRGRIYNVTFL
jgi:hypothetical protein